MLHIRNIATLITTVMLLAGCSGNNIVPSSSGQAKQSLQNWICSPQPTCSQPTPIGPASTTLACAPTSTNVGGGTVIAGSGRGGSGSGIIELSDSRGLKSACVPATRGQKVINAANNFFGHETCKLFGDGGKACADSVNYVLNQAVGRTFGSNTHWVPSVHTGMLAAGFKGESQSSAQPGDIAIAPNDRHIGICMTAGCTQIDSNSTSRCAFKWQSNGTFDGSYSRYGSTTYLNWGTFK
jgi:hypothetical protein